MLYALGHEVVRFFQTLFFSLTSDSKGRNEIASSHVLRAKIRAEIPGEQAEIPGTRGNSRTYPELDLFIFNWNSRVENHEFGRLAPYYSFRTFFLCKIGASVFL